MLADITTIRDLEQRYEEAVETAKFELWEALNKEVEKGCSLGTLQHALGWKTMRAVYRFLTCPPIHPMMGPPLNQAVHPLPVGKKTKIILSPDIEKLFADEKIAPRSWCNYYGINPGQAEVELSGQPDLNIAVWQKLATDFPDAFPGLKIRRRRKEGFVAGLKGNRKEVELEDEAGETRKICFVQSKLLSSAWGYGITWGDATIKFRAMYLVKRNVVMVSKYFAHNKTSNSSHFIDE